MARAHRRKVKQVKKVIQFRKSGLALKFVKHDTYSKFVKKIKWRQLNKTMSVDIEKNQTFTMLFFKNFQLWILLQIMNIAKITDTWIGIVKIRAPNKGGR